MPTYEIKGPDGRTFEVDAPDPQSAVQAIGAHAQAKPGFGAAETALDVGKSAGVGLARGGIGLAGMVDDLSEYGARGLDTATRYIGGKLGADIAPRGNQTPRFGAENLQKGVESVTGEFYKPQTTAGKYAETIGEFAPGAIIPGSLPVRLGVGVLAPALASETAGQLTKGSAAEPYARMAGALTGGLGAGIGAGIVNSRRSMVPGVSGPTSRALEKAVTPGAEQRLAELGPDAFLLDATPSTRQFAQGVGVLPGEGSSRMVDALTRRNEGANTRLTSELDSTLGPAVSPQRLEDALETQRAGLQPLYEAVSGLNNPVNLTSVYDQLRAAIPTEAGATQSALRRVLDMVAPEVGGGNTSVPLGRQVRTNPREVLNVRQALDDELLRLAETPKAHRAVSEYRRLVDDALADAVPDLKVLDATYSNLMRGSEGLRRGTQVFDSGKEAIRPEDLIRERAAMSLPQREAMRHGTRAELDRLVGTKGNDLVALKQVVMADGDWNRVKLAEIFGAREADKIFKAVDREAAFRDAYNKVTQNSQTAQRREAAETLKLDTPAAPSMRDATIFGTLASGVQKGVNAIRGRMDSARTDRMTNELASALTASGPPRDALVRAIREGQTKRRASTVPSRELLARALLNLNTGRD